MTFVSPIRRPSALASLGAIVLAGAVVAAQPFVNPNAPRFPLPTEPRVHETLNRRLR